MVTLTGTFTRLDGTPATGTVRVTPSRSPIMDPDGKIVISGPQVFPLDKAGKLTTEIPASDDPDFGPAFTYSVDVNLAHASWKISKVWIPHGSVTVDLSEIGDYQPVPGVATRVVTIPAGGTDGQVLVWDGAGFTWDYPPEGPPGPPGEVTTAALTTALAGKVTGQGMTVRHDTSVGERVLLDHPGGTTMLYGDTGWRDVASLLFSGFTTDTSGGKARIKRTTNLVEATVSVEVTDDAPFLTTSRSLLQSVLSLASGFGVAQPYSLGGAANLGGTNVGGINPAALITSPLALRFRSSASGGWKAGDIVEMHAVFSTKADWPTTLPGLPG